MTRAISRDSFNELKQYLGVYLQQGRVILDADWNEGQDIMAALARRLGQDAFRDGVVAEGFEIRPVIPMPWGSLYQFALFQCPLVNGQAGLPFLFNFPSTQPFDAFDSMDNWALSPSGGKLRLCRDRPYEGKTFLRLSDHTGQVQVTKTLPSPVDLSASQFAHFRVRLNQAFPTGAPPPGTASFFVEDSSGNRSVWKMTGLWNAQDRWIPEAALPLDLRFQIVDLELAPAFRTQQYNSPVIAVRAPGAVTWSITAGALPPGIIITPQAGTTNASLTSISTSQGPTTSGSFSFTLTATSAGQTASRAYTMVVQDTPNYLGGIYVSGALNDISGDTRARWEGIKPRLSAPTGTPANLASVKKYGFDVFQASPALVWDFDALYLGNHALVNAAAANNFVISGPLQKQITDIVLANSQLKDLPAAEDGNPLIFPSLATSFNRSPRAYVGGLPCTQTRDVLYSEQADPNDPPVVAPTGTAVRQDLVYLDVWREPVTYVEDPDLREIALGGPDTSTRMRVRQRVRVAQGGTLPTGDGTGQGTLATEGTYTDRANRLYLVEVDRAGDIGTATIRWSEDNGSTIQRVIEAIPPGATKVKVEDASAFSPGDFILIRKEFGDEEHQVSSILGNTITLQAPTGAQLGTLPAAARDASFTTFALADRPKIQRWNAFHAPIVADANDPTISAAIDLSRGVKVRFGGRALRKGDYWTFRARYLAGDGATGINPVARIETVEFMPPQGVVHQYTPLALLLRDPGAMYPQRTQLIRDQRRRAGHVVHHHGDHTGVNLTTTTAVPGGIVYLGTTSAQSTFVCIWTGSISSQIANAVIKVDVRFFGNDMNTADDPALTRLLGSTTINNDVASETRFRTAVVIAKPFSDSVLNPAPLVAARPFFTMTNAVVGGGSLVQGELEIIEIKNRTLSLDDMF